MKENQLDQHLIAWDGICYFSALRVETLPGTHGSKTPVSSGLSVEILESAGEVPGENGETVLQRLSFAALLAAFGAWVPMQAAPFNFASVQAFVENASGTVFSTGSGIAAPNSNLTFSWTCDVCTALGYSANGAGTSNNGVLGSSVTIGVPSTPDPGFFIAQTEAHYSDTLTITGGSGSGVLALSYAIHGSISVTGTGPQGVSAGFDMCDDVGCSDPSIFASVNSGPLTSESSQPGSFRSNGTVTFYIPFTYGAPVDIEPLINAQAQFISGSDGIPFSASANFNSTVTLSSASVLTGTPNAPGTQVGGATIGSADSFIYGPNGLTSAVPEPATWLLLCGPLAFLAFRRRVR